MHILTKVGNQDNVVTYEHICDTLQDRDNIEKRYITLGSTCLVLSGENDTIEVYMADSNREWHDIAVAGGSGSGSGGLQLYICNQSEVQDGKPAVEIPMEDVLYLVPGGTEGNLYTEYMYVNNNWELFGGATVDLTNYASKQWVDNAIDALITVSDTAPTDSGTKIWIDSTGGQTVQVPTVAEMNSAIPQSTSQLANDSGFISIAADPESFTGDEIPVYTMDPDAGTAQWEATHFADIFEFFADQYEAQHPLAEVTADIITPIELENNYDTHADYFQTPTYYLSLVTEGGVHTAVLNTDADAWIGKPIRYTNFTVGEEIFDNMSKKVVNNIAEYTVGKDVYVEDAETHILVFSKRVSESEIVTVTGTTPVITATDGTQYICGEVSTLSFTPSATGTCDIIFESGSTATVLTIPSNVRFPEWFDPSDVQPNTTYEISITNGIYGVVMAWPIII